MAEQTIQTVWQRTVERVKQLATSPTLYRGLERTVAITQDNGVFVVGGLEMESQYRAALATAEYQALMERTLREISGDPTLRFRFIEGNSLADWEYAKQRDLASQNRVVQNVQKKATETQTAASWEEAYERVSRLWASFPNRNTVIGRGRYLHAALDIVEESARRLYPADGNADDATERAYSRVIERVATLCGCDAALLAYLLLARTRT